jgi:hypothetical protein
MSDLILISISNFSTKIRLGEHTRSTEEDCSLGICAPRFQEFSIIKAIPHQMYQELLNHDIALLIMDQPARESGIEYKILETQLQ